MSDIQLTSLMSLIVTFLLLVGGCMYGAQLLNRPGVESIITNEDFLYDLNEGLSSFSKQSKTISSNQILKTEEDIYKGAKYLEFELDIKKGELILFFSKGDEDIKLNSYNNDKEVASFIFKRPTVPECNQVACICYASNSYLWDINYSDTNNVKVEFDEDKIKDGFVFNNIVCKTANNPNSIFVNARGYYKDVETKYLFDAEKEKPSLPLEILSTAYLSQKSDSGLKVQENYLSHRFNKDNFKEFPKYLLNNQKWFGGLVLGDFGYSLSGQIDGYKSTGKFNLNVVQFNYESPTLVGLNINSPYVINKDYLQTILPNYYLGQIKNSLEDFELKGTTSEASQRYLNAKDKEIFSKELKTVFLKSQELGILPKITIEAIFKDNEVESSKFKIDINGETRTFDSDFIFLMEKNNPNLCLHAFDGRDNQINFVSCDNNKLYSFEYSSTEGFIKPVVKDNDKKTCDKYVVSYWYDAAKTKEHQISFNNVNLINTDDATASICDKTKKILSSIYFIDGSTYNPLQSIKLPDGNTYYNCGFKKESNTCYNSLNIERSVWGAII